MAVAVPIGTESRMVSAATANVSFNESIHCQSPKNSRYQRNENVSGSLTNSDGVNDTSTETTSGTSNTATVRQFSAISPSQAMRAITGAPPRRAARGSRGT